MQTKYKIYELSARAVISFTVERDGIYHFELSSAATKKSFVPGAVHEQENSALFFQIMCALHGDDFTMPAHAKVIPDLSGVLFYMDFSGIFDRSGAMKKYGVRQQKARDLFRPEGVTLDFGDGAHRYLAFERSASMSRSSRLSFIRADLYDEVHRRIMMDIHIGDCQLSKLYAYNGLMLSSGTRVDNIQIDKPHRVIVIDNPVRIIKDVPVVTVRDDGTQRSTRRYFRETRSEDIEVLCFDGEGLISWEYAEIIDSAFCGRHTHTSFQIRMPYVKGMVHQVDFKDFLSNAGTTTITDLWGVSHNVADVDIILTKSMFKGYGWLTDDHKTWEDYWDAFRRYRHALYITNVSKPVASATTDLNYQFLNSLSLSDYEFRLQELPDGWERSPAEHTYPWLTKQTELAYYNLCANERFRIDHFLKVSETDDPSGDQQESLMARVLKKNPLFISEPAYADELNSKAEKQLEQYSLGHLIVAGDNRYLSADLLDLMLTMVNPAKLKTAKERRFFLRAQNCIFSGNECYAPGHCYEYDGSCTLFRNPHIAKNEEAQVHLHTSPDELREKYLGHLTDVVMVSAQGLCAERLAGADFDGDMVKTITDPIICDCVKRNTLRLTGNGSILYKHTAPLLHIPAAKPQIRNANDWHARFEAVSGAFFSRVGHISNAALDRSVIAYNENAPAAERQRYQEETETLAILTGLEIDSAKSGIRPDLSEYLGRAKVPRSPFLQYKALLEEKESKRRMDEPGRAQRIEAFFQKYDWSKMSSNLERIPYLARQLKKYTPKIKSKPASDRELFAFAQDERWKDALDSNILDAVAELLQDYEACLSRIRACRAPIQKRRREAEISRILFSRGQESWADPDELYARFQEIAPERISSLRQAVTDEAWCFMTQDRREAFLVEYLPEFEDMFDLLSNFRCSGFKLLGDLICDVDDENIAQERKMLFRETDSAAFAALMRAYTTAPRTGAYDEAVSKACRIELDRIVEPSAAVQYVAALGKRRLLFALLPDVLEENIREVRHAE